MKHFLNDIEIAPRNLFEFGVLSNFNDNPALLEIDADKVILPREAMYIVKNHIENQGLFEGIPYRIEMQGGISFEYYVDLTDDAIFRSYEVELKIKRRKGKDNFFDNANGTSFELLNAKGVQFQFIDVPYVIIKDNAGELALILAISTYSMTQALIESFKQTAEATAALIEAITPNATVPPLPPAGSIISLAIKLAAQLAYTIALLVAVIKLGKQLFEVIFPNVRYYKACKVKELVSKGCAYLGYSVQSTLLDSIPNWTILPAPLVKKKKSIFDYLENDLNFSFTKGYPTSRDTTPTLGSLITEIETIFNARTRVVNGVVQIERRDYWSTTTLNAIVPALNIQDDRQEEYRYNTDEVWKRYYISWLVDYNDLNTIDNYDPVNAEYSTEPNNVINPDIVSIKNLFDVQMKFALGKRKEKLTFGEQTAKVFFAVVDAVSNVFGGGTNFVAGINDRIGILQISQQFYSTTKMLYLVSAKQPANYIDLMKASSIYNQYHKINEIQNNDYKIYSDVPVRLRPQDFVSLLNNNFAEVNGSVCEILSIRYNDEISKAIVTYKFRNNYANGKINILTIDD